MKMQGTRTSKHGGEQRVQNALSRDQGRVGQQLLGGWARHPHGPQLQHGVLLHVHIIVYNVNECDQACGHHCQQYLWMCGAFQAARWSSRIQPLCESPEVLAIPRLGEIAWSWCCQGGHPLHMGHKSDRLDELASWLLLPRFSTIHGPRLRSAGTQAAPAHGRC